MANGKETTGKNYIGVWMVHAVPEVRAGKPGYAVKYQDGYKGWIPKGVFESAYFQIDRIDLVTQKDVDRMISYSDVNFGFIGKTAVTQVFLPTGYDITGCSALEDTSEAKEISMEKIKVKLQNLLYFVHFWARNGLKSIGGANE